MRRQRIDALPKKFGGKWGWRGWCGSCLRRSMLASPGGDWPICLELEQAPRWMPRVNHMHLRGKDARFEATYPDGRKETLLLVPHYNFNWQITRSEERRVGKECRSRR